MIYHATRVSRSEGFRWDEGTPLDYQHASDTLMGCQISDRPYYVICGHTPLRVTISEGQRVDSRENRLYAAEELKGKPDAEGGIRLLSALLSGPNGQGTVIYPDAAQFEQALLYAAAHLPRSRTGHIIISENVPEYGTTVLLVFRREMQQISVPAWIPYLPEFAAPADGTAKPAGNGTVPTYDAVYDAILHDNSRNHNLRMLTFLAFSCGAEADPAATDEYTQYIQAFSPDEALIRRFFRSLTPDDFDAPAMLPVLYGLSGAEGDRILASCVRSCLTPEMIRQIENNTPPPKIGNIVRSFTRAYERGYEKFSLEKASVAELFELYQYISDRQIKASELRQVFARDENSVSMYELFAAEEQRAKQAGGDTKTKVHGIMPAVLYWYDEINKEECAALCGSQQAAAKSIAQVKLLAVPKRMQKLEFRDDFYEKQEEKPRLRDVQNLPRLILAGLASVICLLTAGGVVGGMLTYGKMQNGRPEPTAQATGTESAATQTTPAVTTATTPLPAETMPQEPAVLRTLSCRIDAETQTQAEEFAAANPDLPTGLDFTKAVLYYSISTAELPAFSPEALPAARYMIPYVNADGCGVICLVRQGDGTLALSQTVPGPDAETLPSVWFDLLQVERDLSRRTAEPSAVMLLMCTDGPYRKLVYTDLGGTGYVIPYLFSADAAGGLLPLEDGASYSAADYLKWLGYRG